MFTFRGSHVQKYEIIDASVQHRQTTRNVMWITIELKAENVKRPKVHK